MNKFKNFLLNKGIYLIALGCVAVVCLSGLYIMNVINRDKDANPNKTSVTKSPDAKDVIALPTFKADSSGTKSTQNVQTPPVSTQQSGPINTANVNPATNANAGTAQNPSYMKLELPVKGKIINDYAMDKLVYNKTLDEWRTHSGADIASALGTPVLAAGDGKVIDVKKDPRLGYLIIVEHAGSLKTVYANLKEEACVKIGDQVKKGDGLGWVGKSAAFEFADEPHLHFEVLLNDNCVDVWNYCKKE